MVAGVVRVAAGAAALALAYAEGGLRAAGAGRLWDCVAAVATGFARLALDWRPRLPWITFPALRFLRRRLGPRSRVFEWGCGMSTLWLDRRCAEVHAAEDNADWHARIAGRVRRAAVYLLSGPAYVERILDFPEGYFDLISVDGSQRLACFRLALDRIGRGGMLLVDNTDNDRTTGGDLYVIDRMISEVGPEWEVHRFPGWGPGNFFAWETTVCVRR